MRKFLQSFRLRKNFTGMCMENTAYLYNTINYNFLNFKKSNAPVIGAIMQIITLKGGGGLIQRYSILLIYFLKNYYYLDCRAPFELCLDHRANHHPPFM